MSLEINKNTSSSILSPLNDKIYNPVTHSVYAITHVWNTYHLGLKTALDVKQL